MIHHIRSVVECLGTPGAGSSVWKRSEGVDKLVAWDAFSIVGHNKVSSIGARGSVELYPCYCT